MSILIVESGSTKTDWCLVHKTGKPTYTKTSGINPLLQSKEDMVHTLQSELKINLKKQQPEKIFYYGAGISNKQLQDKVTSVLKHYFSVKNIEVQSDILGAARSLSGNNKGMVCILGTGSNCCYFDGKKIQLLQPSLGYIAGDEGSGNYLGKKVLQYYAYNTFDEELKTAFEKHFGNDLRQLIQRLYNEPFPNRLLASFAILLIENRGHFMVENIIEDGLHEFFQTHLLKYRQIWKHPIHFTGSIAYYFQDVLRSLCSQYEVELGNVLQSPLEGLIKYHRQITFKNYSK